MSLAIEYRLLNAGWAECTLRVGDISRELSASYLSDALGNLVLAATGVLSGLQRVSTSFDEEPGEYRWVIERATGVEISLKVLAFDQLWGNQPDSEGEVLVQTTCHPLIFGEAVLKAASAVLAEHGESGSLEKWVEHEFPLCQLDLLTEYIGRWRRHS